jgi:hypothetical protein
MKCVAIGGVPASGKTTLMRNYLYLLKPNKKFQKGLLRGYHDTKSDTSVLGIYDLGEVFAGTDKLSMAVQKDFESYVAMHDKNIVFEGDRLFTANNLKLLNQDYDIRIIILEGDSATLEKRHEQRGDKQTEKFKKGRLTKIQNIKEDKELSNIIELVSLRDLEESKSLAKDLFEFTK